MFFWEYFVTFLISIQSLETILGLMGKPLGVSWTNLKTNLESFWTNLGQIQSLSDQSWINLESLGPILKKFRVSWTNHGQIQRLLEPSCIIMEQIKSLGTILWFLETFLGFFDKTVTSMGYIGVSLNHLQVSQNNFRYSWNNLESFGTIQGLFEQFGSLGRIQVLLEQYRASLNNLESLGTS